MGLKSQNWQHSLALLPWASTDLQDVMGYEMCLLCSSDNWPCKSDVLKIAWGGRAGGPQKGTKSSTFWGFKGIGAWGHTSKLHIFVNSGS